MCGLAGAVGRRSPVPPGIADAVLGRIEHRGPDAAGSSHRGPVWLGFRRLSIQDLSHRADQPMLDPDTDVAIVFNGEAYNFVELRDELEGLGHRFRTHGDTEVVLRGYLAWGIRVLERINGMFALAIDDPRHDVVVLARDRFGEKPLHYGVGGDGDLWFASEPGALRSAGVGSGRLDLSRTLALLAHGDIEDPAGTYFAGIRQLPPAHVAEIERRSGTITSLRPWWSLDELLARAWDRGPADDAEVLEGLDEAVKLRLRSDVEVGTSLSGGLDSSAIVASMRAMGADRGLHAFNASFPGRTIDEWTHAERVAASCDVQLHRVEPSAARFVADLDDVVRHQGAPFESPTVFAQWCVMSAARSAGVTVLLDGQGADETWGGYPKLVWFGLGELLGRGRFGASRRYHRAWHELGGIPRPSVAQAAALALPSSARPALVAVAGARARRSLGPALDDAVLADPQGDVGRGPLLERAARVDLGRGILPRLLRYADRNSMAWSREVRLPYLDPSLAELGLRSGWSSGLASGWTKVALRRAVAGRLPGEVVWRRDKVAYTTPDADWLEDPAIAAMIHDARRHLATIGLLLPDDHRTNPWRALSLSRFVELNGLTT